MSKPIERQMPRVVQDVRDNPEYRRKVTAGTARKERWRRDVFRTPGICKTTINDLIEKGKL